MVGSNLLLGSKYLLCTVGGFKKECLLENIQIAMCIICLLSYRTNNESEILDLKCDVNMLRQLSSVVHELCNMQKADMRKLIEEQNISAMFRICSVLGTAYFDDNNSIDPRTNTYVVANVGFLDLACRFATKVANFRMRIETTWNYLQFI